MAVLDNPRRGILCSGVPDEVVWCVVDPWVFEARGVVLEWCYNEEDAMVMKEKLESSGKHAHLLARKYLQ